MIKFIKGIFPAIVSYSTNLKSGFAGQTSGFVVTIRPECKSDEGLLQHELVHVWQFYRTFGIHSILYKFIEKYRLSCEIEAYKKQLKYSPDYLLYYAERVATMYDIKITKKEVLMLLKE
jgi:hypothetical protein